MGHHAGHLVLGTRASRPILYRMVRLRRPAWTRGRQRICCAERGDPRGYLLGAPRPAIRRRLDLPSHGEHGESRRIHDKHRHTGTRHICVKCARWRDDIGRARHVCSLDRDDYWDFGRAAIQRCGNLRAVYIRAVDYVWVSNIVTTKYSSVLPSHCRQDRAFRSAFCGSGYPEGETHGQDPVNAYHASDCETSLCLDHIVLNLP